MKNGVQEDCCFYPVIGGLADDCHFVNQVLGSRVLVDDEEDVTDIYTGRTLQLGIVGDVAGQPFVVAVESGTDELAFAVEDR